MILPVLHTGERGLSLMGCIFCFGWCIYFWSWCQCSHWFGILRRRYFQQLFIQSSSVFCIWIKSVELVTSRNRHSVIFELECITTVQWYLFGIIEPMMLLSQDRVQQQEYFPGIPTIIPVMFRFESSFRLSWHESNKNRSLDPIIL